MIADEHAATRAGIRTVLEDAGFDICGEVTDAQAAVQTAARERPELALLDVDIPGSGIAAAEAITARVPETSVVMLTASTADADLFDALRAGAVGYLLKGTDSARLVHALRGVLAGEAAIPRTLVTRIVSEFGGRTRRHLTLARRGIELTPREGEVLEPPACGTHDRADGGAPVRVAGHRAASRLHPPSQARRARPRDRRPHARRRAGPLGAWVSNP
ncbi:MAG: response regulator transcription factor [Thermoleophilaceae bacterium]